MIYSGPRPAALITENGILAHSFDEQFLSLVTLFDRDSRFAATHGRKVLRTG